MRKKHKSQIKGMTEQGNTFMHYEIKECTKNAKDIEKNISNTSWRYDFLLYHELGILNIMYEKFSFNFLNLFFWAHNPCNTIHHCVKQQARLIIAMITLIYMYIYPFQGIHCCQWQYIVMQAYTILSPSTADYVRTTDFYLK